MAIATIYVTLIMEGDKTFAQVPKQDKLRAEVKRQLEVLGFPELAQQYDERGAAEVAP